MHTNKQTALPTPVRLGVALGLAALALGVLLVLTAMAAPGDLDPTFDGDGKVTTDFGGDNLGYAVAVQPDGKIVVAGHSNSGGTYDFAVARYNADGSPDTTFGASGVVTTDFGGDDRGSAVAI
jgi:uncharacterized delta-60 repeat protein